MLNRGALRSRPVPVFTPGTRHRRDPSPPRSCSVASFRLWPLAIIPQICNVRRRDGVYTVNSMADRAPPKGFASCRRALTLAAGRSQIATPRKARPPPRGTPSRTTPWHDSRRRRLQPVRRPPMRSPGPVGRTKCVQASQGSLRHRRRRQPLRRVVLSPAPDKRTKSASPFRRSSGASRRARSRRHRRRHQNP